MNIIEELKQINVDLNFAVEFHDGLVVKSQIKKLDALIPKLEKILNGETLESGKSVCHCTGSVEVHQINDKFICTTCNKPIWQT